MNEIFLTALETNSFYRQNQLKFRYFIGSNERRTFSQFYFDFIGIECIRFGKGKIQIFTN